MSDSHCYRYLTDWSTAISPLTFDKSALYSFVDYQGESMPQPADLLQGTLDMLILKAIANEPQHGWAIAQRIQQVSNNVLQVGQGSLYPALHRLERKGWIAARWESAGKDLKREYKFYRLTPAGKKQFLAEESKWKQMTGAIARILWPAEEG